MSDDQFADDIELLSELALTPYESCNQPGRRGCGSCDACADFLHFAEDEMKDRRDAA